MTTRASSELVTLKGGLVVHLSSIERLIELQARGAEFRLVDGGRFRVVPASVLTSDDTAYLRGHRDEARRLIDYDARMRAEPL